MLASLIPGRLENVELDVTFLDDTRISAEVAQSAAAAAAAERASKRSRSTPVTYAVHLTGNVGDVMKESVYAAFTYIRARAEKLGLEPDFMTKMDVHVHLPQGAIPKDGPAGGIAVFVALASLLTQLKVRPDVAMSGELTLRGHVLKVSGIKEKCLAAQRAGIKHVIFPSRNEPDLDDVPDAIKRDLEIHLVSKLDEVLPLVLDLPPAPDEAAAAEE